MSQLPEVAVVRGHMNLCTRRRFLQSAGAAAVCAAATPAQEEVPKRALSEELDRILNAPVLTLDSVKRPVQRHPHRQADGGTRLRLLRGTVRV